MKRIMKRRVHPAPISTKNQTLQESREACVIAHAECEFAHRLLQCHKNAIATIEEAIKEPGRIHKDADPLKEASECLVHPSIQQWIDFVRAHPYYNKIYTQEQEESQSAEFQNGIEGWNVKTATLNSEIIDKAREYAKTVQEYQDLMQKRTIAPMHQPMLGEGQGGAMLVQSPTQSMEID